MVLLLLCGLFLGSAFGPAVASGPDGPGSRLAQSRAAKAFVAVRIVTRDAAAEEAEGLGDGPLLALGGAIVRQTIELRPVPPFRAVHDGERPRLPLLAYRARAPPAA